jgi:spore maturation protein CgeB
MRILFLGVFSHGSTNVSQRESLKNIGHYVEEFSYRNIPSFNGVLSEMVDGYDMLLIAKGSGLAVSSINKFRLNNNAKIIYWFMDPLRSYTNEMIDKTRVADISYFDKINVLKKAKKFNEHSYYLCEGFDETVDCKRDVKKEYNVSFIGGVYNNRSSMLSGIDNLKIINNAYGTKHSFEVSRTKININVCTDDGASDRVYKILAAGGFLLTDDWNGRELTGLEDKKDLVIFKDKDDLDSKIKYYLNNKEERETIASSGHVSVQRLNRTNWAKGIICKV